MSARYMTDEDILSAAHITEVDMTVLSNLAYQKHADMLENMRDDGISFCKVAWPDDTMGFLTYESASKQPPAWLIITAYRNHHRLPTQMSVQGGRQ